jgi:ABC-type phosphate/phosphonate transport system substrate-binding protein
MRRSYLAVVGTIAAMTSLSAPAADPVRIQIGVLPTLYRGGEPGFAFAIQKPMLAEIELETGVVCELKLAFNSSDMSKKLKDGRLHFGLCHGFEFAWMQSTEPKLKPLMIAVPTRRPLKAMVAVAISNPAKNLCDLSGKILAIPTGGDALINLFVDRKCRCEEKPPAEYFREITRPLNSETALHELYEDKVQAAIVDGAALQAFAERYPARSKLIRTLVESGPFPLSAVVYFEGAVDPATVRLFQEVMGKARDNRAARQLMALMHCEGFDGVPEDYGTQLTEFLKRYPRVKPAD